MQWNFILCQLAAMRSGSTLCASVGTMLFGFPLFEGEKENYKIKTSARWLLCAVLFFRVGLLCTSGFFFLLLLAACSKCVGGETFRRGYGFLSRQQCFPFGSVCFVRLGGLCPLGNVTKKKFRIHIKPEYFHYVIPDNCLFTLSIDYVDDAFDNSELNKISNTMSTYLQCED